MRRMRRMGRVRSMLREHHAVAGLVHGISRYWPSPPQILARVRLFRHRDQQTGVSSWP